MILICPDCDTRYKITTNILPPEGRKVRCRACGYVWTARPSTLPEEPLTLPPPEPPPDPHVVEAPQVIPEAHSAQGYSHQSHAQQQASPHPQQVQPEQVTPEQVAPEDMFSPRQDYANRLSPIPTIPAISVYERPRRSLFSLSSWSGVIGLALLAGLSFYFIQSGGVQLLSETFTRKIGVTQRVPAGQLEVTQARYAFEQRQEGRALVVQGRIENMSLDKAVQTQPVRVKLFDQGGEVIYTWVLQVNVRMLNPGQSEGFIGRLMYPPEATTQVTVEIES